MATPNKPKGRRTVASVGAELDALREQVAALQSRLDALEGGGATAVPAAAVAAAAVTTRPAAKPAPEEDAVTAIRSLLSAAFEMALQPVPDDPDDADAQFTAFAALMHSDRRGTPLLEQSLRNYTWRQLRKNVEIYLDEDNTPGSFQVARMTPDPVGKKTERAKLFLRARTRMPTPVTLRRDEREGGAWRIESSSL